MKTNVFIWSTMTTQHSCLLASQKLSCPLDRLTHHCVLQRKPFSTLDNWMRCNYTWGLHSLKTEHNSAGLLSNYLLRFRVCWKQPVPALSYAIRTSLPFILLAFLQGTRSQNLKSWTEVNSGGNPNSRISKWLSRIKSEPFDLDMGPDLPRQLLHRGGKNRQCNLLIVFLMVSGLFVYYSLCSVLLWEPTKTPRRGEQKRKTSAQQTTCQSWSAEHAMFLALLKLPTITEHEEESKYLWRCFIDLYSEKYITNVLAFPWIPSECSPLPSFIQCIQ